jgi:Flp pilus assembly protein TadD
MLETAIPTVTPEILPHLGLLRLQRGDEKGYRRACAELLERYGKTRQPWDANTVARACALLPDAVTDYTQPLALARLAATQKGFATLNTLGTLLYRAGKDEEAIATLLEAIQEHRKGGTPADWLILALCEQRRDYPEEARRWFDKAVAELDALETRGIRNWAMRIELEALRREAESLLAVPRP